MKRIEDYVKDIEQEVLTITRNRKFRVEEHEEERLKDLIHSMYNRGYPPDKIRERCGKLITNYLRIMGYDENGMRGEFVKTR